MEFPRSEYIDTLHHSYTTPTPLLHHLDIDSYEIVNACAEETFRDVLARSFSLIESRANHITPLDGAVPFHWSTSFVSLPRWELQRLRPL